MGYRLRIPLVQLGNEKLYYLKNSDLMLHDGEGEHHIWRIEEPAVISWMRRSKLLVRLMRLIPRGACCSRGRYIILSLRKKVYIVDAVQGQLCGLFSVGRGFSNPLNITPDDGSPDYIAYYGDYGDNPGLDPIHIYGITCGYERKILYTFSQGEIRHIHNIVRAADHDGYYVFTGDHGKGVGIYKFDRAFQRRTEIASGNEQYRAVRGFERNRKLYYATDTVMEANHAFCVEEPMSGRRIRTLGELCGSCIYGEKLAGGYIFASCVESSEDVKGKIRKLFTRKLGKGIRDRYARLYYLDEWEKIQEVTKLLKDDWPITLFQYGTVLFPSVVGTNERLYCLPISVKKKDLKLSVIEKKEETNEFVFRVCSKGLW